MRYPIGIQSFEKIRRGGFLYVDKTAILHKLVNSFGYVFLGRPRRFGKSLLMSTVQAYFEGRKDLFEGLAVDSLKKEWVKHPVIHLDLNTGDYRNNGKKEMLSVLNYQLRRYEDVYGGIDDTLSNRFLNLIRSAKEMTGENVVVLIDEYDKPILSGIGAEEEDEIRNVLKSFYGCLKSSDEYLRFVMLTGVSKFGKLSVFSDLNNIKDISMIPDYAAICGITQNEIIDNFGASISKFSESIDVTADELIEMLRMRYDGYRFTKSDIKVFNPYSLLNAFADNELKDYWFESGTPSSLVNILRQSNYELEEIDGSKVPADSLYKEDRLSAVPILYQSGYLTIGDYDANRNICTLSYPNDEVKAGFLNYLLPYYSNVRPIDSAAEIFCLIDEINEGDIEAFMTRIKSIFYAIPYGRDNSAKVQEDQFRNLMYLVFRLIGMNIQVECPMSRGRSDAIIFTDDHIYVMEFKIDHSPEQAIAQIIEKGYAEPYRADRRTVTLIGVNYSTSSRMITGWVEMPAF